MTIDCSDCFLWWVIVFVSILTQQGAANATPVLEVLTGDQLDLLSTLDGGQWAVYDCSRNETLVYEPTLPTSSPSPKPSTVAPTLSPTPPPTASPTAPPTASPPTTSPATASPTEPPTVSPTNPPTSPPTAAPILPPTFPLTTSPTMTSTALTSLLPNWNFEDGLAPWTSNGGGATVMREFDAQQNGFVATIRGRDSATWQGIGQDVTDLLEVGEDYNFRISAKLLDVANDVTALLKLTLAIEDDSPSIRYPGAIYVEDGLSTEWQTFEGYFGPLEVTGEVSSIRLFAEGPPIGISFAVDDVMVTADLTTSSPTMAPTSPPTQPDFLVSADQNTEQVIIPQPPPADFSPNTARNDCPHLQGTFVDFHSYFGSLSNGQDITIPLDTIMLISRTVPETLGFVTIPATSTLVFGENDDGIAFDVGGIQVEGSLIAGSETCRLQTQLDITLHGNRPLGAQSEEYKGISVTGLLSLHGKRYYRTMTRLARRALPGDTMLYVQDVVNWELDQEIVLVTTAIRDSRDWHENEVFVVDRVETSNMPYPEVKSVVHLTSAVQNGHIARPEYQAEIGLLSRVIKIQGAADDSLPTDTQPASCQLYDHNGNARNVFGYDQVDCPTTYLTGYGGHIIIHGGGRGYVEGVELFRMGQTNFLGRYPIHFHQLGNGCADCYWKDSSVHESFYRCISIHGTNNLTVTENVAYDVTGFCYYLEDGVEEFNEISYNLAAHVHFIDSPALGGAQQINYVTATPDLTLPADVTAAGFYITNLHNFVIGNVASGGWAGFAFPVFDSPTGPNKDLDYSPKEKAALVIDGNTAHSTAYFWGSSAAFYFGGALFYDDNDQLVYNAGRERSSSQRRNPCIEDEDTGDCIPTENRITNTKVFLTPNVGIGSWSGKMEVINYEAHDVGLSLEALQSGFWIDQMTVTCRTTELLKMPVQRARDIRGNAFVWYDTGQDHIITDSVFKNCGYRSDDYDQYDASPTRGCNDNDENGCYHQSSVFGFLTHSDEFNPEIMQATKNITMIDVGRRFRFSRTDIESVSGRTQNWYDVDGTVSGLGTSLNPKPTIIGSGLPSALNWWLIDDDAILDSQGPVVFVQEANGPARGLAHVRFEWDDALHSTVGSSDCVNGRLAGQGPFCLPHGYVRHLGEMFANEAGLPVTAQPEVVGLAGGFGWLLTLNEGAPKELKIMQMEVLPSTPLLLSLQYPFGTSVSVTAKAVSWCYESCTNSCEEPFTEVASVENVRTSDGNVYHYDSDTGFLTLRVIMFPETSTGEPEWKLYDFDDIRSNGGGYALKRYSRKGVLLPLSAFDQAHISIVADCNTGGTNGAYCSQSTENNVNLDNVCTTPGFIQVSYDRCCDPNDSSSCEYPYSMIAAPTPSPTVTAAPTFPDPELLDNGDFEGGPCPWEVSWNTEGTEETTLVQKGSSSLRLSGRTHSWQGAGQSIFGKLKLGTTYAFTGWVYLLTGGTTNRFVVNSQLIYDTSTESCSQEHQYRSIYNSGNSLVGHSFHFMSSSYTLNSGDLLEGCTLIGLRLYVETPGSIVDFIVDGFSFQATSSSSSRRNLRSILS